MKSKHIFAIFFFCILTATLFSGCNTDSSTAANTQIDEAVSFSDTATESEILLPDTSESQYQPPSEILDSPLLIDEPNDDDLVRVIDYIPTMEQELAYATVNNFTGKQIYEFTDAYLRYGTVKKLIEVSEELSEQGIYIKIWDAFRPISAQEKLWEICPDPTYVSHPTTGNRSHCRGSAVDITLIDAYGNELEMPSGFDDFSLAADRDYSDCTEAAAANAKLLQDVMEKHGFVGYSQEWWHFSDIESYPVEESFKPVAASWWYADCNEFITLRTDPSLSASAITRISVNSKFQLMAIDGDFCLVNYEGMVGYVLKSYIRPV